MRHGTRYAYKTKGCRCEECRAWQNAYMRHYRQQRKARTGTRMLRGKFVGGAGDSDIQPEPVPVKSAGCKAG